MGWGAYTSLEGKVTVKTLKEAQLCLCLFGASNKKLEKIGEQKIEQEGGKIGHRENHRAGRDPRIDAQAVNE